MIEKELNLLLEEIFSKNQLCYSVWSSPRSPTSRRKIVIRPIQRQNILVYQISSQIEEKVFHQNTSKKECLQFIKTNLIQEYQQGLICTPEADFQILISKKQKITILRRPPSKPKQKFSHNIKKQYILEEGSPNPFLIAVGIMTPEGKILSKKQAKFRQINRFLELIDDIVPFLRKDKTIQIVDFGCGKAYLTFALYHYLHLIRGFPINVIGLDLKSDVITHCQEIAKQLYYEHLHFSVGDISQFVFKEKVDLVVTLHACDTATDAALEKAVRWGADVILSVPCCQHELFQQVKNDKLSPLLKHGILKERFSSLVTDAARAQILTILGYHTQILEFISLEHTAKNLMIRAVLKKSKTKNLRALQSYLQFKEELAITPYLEERFNILDSNFPT